ncbi:Protein of uncharacterised function (DUF2612) [Anaerococcus prevotii]|uniref:Uncharacterized protein n=1 Tax=Anaerococcus prevotii (strain ATCC 9321 / DSM 20548 / JCM 6508 / NCTC 11806 / PC1) TaxID=525919 RepID=C7RHC3_ANAPD|nr:hypothetical protein [Anaerococcus prevotii]ACV28884.1 hypothetical protein Apre_0856 [Anaerococcus prevotii DSM 20548]SUU94557.1 Protein of uncharacterised function (DUF2612) [Anaerococcus prevotii]
MYNDLYLKAWKRLPERFRKQTNKDLYYVLYNGSGELEKAFSSIEESHNIDKAYGKTLDLLGANVGEIRADNMSDDLYRLYIKVRIISNLSIGDIPTINYVMSTLLGDDYISIKEGFLDGDYLYNEPAALRLSIMNTADIVPYEILERIKAAGIRILIDQIYALQFKLQTRYGIDSCKVWLCGEHPCGDIPYTYAIGQGSYIDLKAKSGLYNSENYYGYAPKGGLIIMRDDKNREFRYVQDMSSDRRINFGGKDD